MQPTVQQIIDQFEQFAPPRYAEPHDPIGLQIGNRDQIVHKVLVTLDVRPEVVQEAIANQVDLILAHHPLMFRPAPHLDYRDPQQRMYMDLIQHQISVFAAHTNLDETPGGMNDWLGEKIGLQNLRPFNRRTKDFSEPSIYLGVVGELPTTQSVLAFAQTCKQVFNVSGLRLTTQHPEQLVKRVAIIGGDGGKFYRTALAEEADILITGDVYYHTAHDMLAEGLSVIDPGHHIEAVIMERLPPLLKEWQQQHDWQFEIQVSQINTDPFQFI